MLRYFLLSTLLLLSFIRTLATEERYLNEIKGNEIYVSQVFSVRDEKFGAPGWNLIDQNVSVNNITTFEINFDTDKYFYSQPFSCTLNFKIYIYGNETDTTIITDSVTHSNINLLVRFDTVTGKSYKAIAMYKFKNAHKYGIRVLGLTSPEFVGTIPPIFRVKSEIIVDRKYTFLDYSTDVTQYERVNGNQLLLNWNPLKYPGAEMFDIEYMHVDYSSALADVIKAPGIITSDSLVDGLDTLQINKWFKNNSTRITTSANSYLLNIPYDSGYIVFRIRGVQIHHPDNIRWEGLWNYKASWVALACTTACYQSVVFFKGHEQKLNWQYSASFAEEGKRKEVISYFDGTLRNRQTVTISNSENKNIVQETIYDALGRPSLNILPSPTMDSTIHYFRGFNLNDATTPVPYSYSDIVYDNCEITAGPLSNTSGTSKYYSSENDFLDKYYHATFIPDAFGVPFAVTEYMPDNTGRVKAQGGVGSQFQLNSQGATSYYYGKPKPTELDRLFGNEAGNVSHYLKNMVKDPNGQVSVSYVDASGRTIATALAGKAADSLYPLQSSVGASTRTKDELIQPTDLRKDASRNSLTATATFLAPVPGDYTIGYKLDPSKMEKWFGAQKDSVICNHCYYNLVITVKDNCNEIKGSHTEFAGNFFDTTCATSVMALDDSFTVSINQIGEYYVDYKLQISDSALNFYDSVHLEKNTDIYKLNFFLLEELKKSDFYGCFNRCETCLDALGNDSAVFNQRIKNLFLADSLEFTTADSLYAFELFDSLYSNCLRIQTGCGKGICEEKLDLLKADVSPGGQYALYDSLNVLLEPAINIISKRNQIAFFSNEFGIRDSVLFKNMGGEDSVLVDVKDLNDSLFIKYWNPTWADSLVRLHPEYCNYLWCIANEGSYIFDRNIDNWGDADTARMYGWFSPTAYDTILTKDPFFNGAGNRAALKEKMRKELRLFSRNYVGTAQPDKNILQFIDIILYCKEQSDGWGNCRVDDNCRSRNREWFLYKSMYANLKRKYYQEAMRSSENEVFENCANCFIGKDLIEMIPKCIPPDTSSFNLHLNDSVRISHPAGAIGKDVILTVTYFGCDTLSLVYPFKGSISDTSFPLPPLECSPDSIYFTVSCDTAIAPYSNFVLPGCSYNCSAGVYNPYDKDSVSVYIEYGSPTTPPSGSPTGYGQWQFYPIYNLQTGTTTSCQFTNVWVGIIDSTNLSWTCPHPASFNVYYSTPYCEGDSKYSVTVTYFGPPIPDGVTVYAHIQESAPFQIWNYSMPFTTGQTVKTECSPFLISDPPGISIDYVWCSGAPPTGDTLYIYPPSSCPENPLADAYAGKIRRYPEYVNSADYMSDQQAQNPSKGAEEALQQAKVQCQFTCEAQANLWMAQLSGCVGNAEQKEALKKALVEICAAGCSLETPFGTSTIPMEITAAYHSFEEAIIGILGEEAINSNCAVELLASPYPHTVRPVLTERTIFESNYDICSKLGLYKTKYQYSGFIGSFHTWLVVNAGTAYTLDSLELNDLLNSCANCNGILKNDLVLPAMFEPEGEACLNCNLVTEGFANFFEKFPGIDTTGDNYAPMMSNFLNQRFGYSLTYEQYKTFFDRCHNEGFGDFMLCNRPVTETFTVPNDGSDCMEKTFASALTIAAGRYQVYIDSVRKDFRDAYTTRCLNAESSVSLSAELLEYHYTLYYYDQSGNLVKTIPPAGVSLIQEQEKLDSIKTYRSLHNSGCYRYTDDIEMNNNGWVAWSGVPTIESGAFTIEFTTSLTGHGDQVMLAKITENVFLMPLRQLHKGYTINIIDDKIEITLFGTTSDLTQRKLVLRSILNAGVLLPANQWRNMAIVRNAGFGQPIQLYVNGNPVVLETVENDLQLSTSVSGGGQLIVGAHLAEFLELPGKLTGSIKNLRMYNRPLSSMEIRQNVFSYCQTPANSTGLKFWAPMDAAYDDKVRDFVNSKDGALFGIEWEPYPAVYPDHGLPTKYEYNSLNQVVKQHTPDADESEFWYDRLGRLTASQNKEQKENAGYNGATADRYSYTRYDNLGRIKEVGEKSGAEDIREIDMLDSTAVKNWLTSGTDRQITKTIYDLPVSTFQNILASRKRVTASIYLESSGNGEGDSTLYNYDILGNVKTLQQHIKALVAVDGTNGKKQIDYDYDLVSGKVNRVSYQLGKGDQFMYSYLYDADNRVIESRSSRDGLVWRTDASYLYYLHGPLARTELGHLKSQGVDYAYTLQGWLKGINSDTLNPFYDMARDGHFSSIYKRVARDVYGMKLGYYGGDYAQINIPAYSFIYKTYAYPGTFQETGNALLNGNISSSTVALSKINDGATTAYTYGYDQLNRLVKMRQNYVPGFATWDENSPLNQYRESIAYDANGNITSYRRNGSAADSLMDNLTYHYNLDGGKLLTNKLNYVTDAINSSYTVDIDTQGASNYSYDNIGNLTRDVSEGIDTVRWTVYGKINRIEKGVNFGTRLIEYGYDPAGNRILKKATTGGTDTLTFYVRDAQGNVLAVYSKLGSNGLKWNEQHLYGSSRLGVWHWEEEIPAAAPNVSGTSLEDSLHAGNRNYELTNHLGNVLATISDKIIGNDSSGVSNYFLAESLIQQDYYPFGMSMPGRKFDLSSLKYRYGFNGQEQSTEIDGDGNLYTAQFWEYDSRIARRWNLDPKPVTGLSQYSVFSNNSIWFSDILGDTITLPKGLETQAQQKLDELTKGDPYFKEILNQLQLSKNINVKIELDPKLKVGGLFNPATSVLKLRSLDAISNDKGSTNEEFFHAFQTIFYGSKLMMGKVGGSNFELEPKFLQAYKEFEATGNINLMDPTFSYIPDINSIVKSATVNYELPYFRKITYVELANTFSQHWQEQKLKGNYSEQPIFLGPDAAMYIINKVRQRKERISQSERSLDDIIIKVKRKKK